MENEKKELRYRGYFLLDTGTKISFDISENDGGENFSKELYGNANFPWKKGDTIWMGEDNDYSLLVERIIGFHVEEVEEK